MRAAILGLALILVGGAASADPAGARSHFLSGLELYSQGKYAAALAEYQAAWVTWEDPELLLDMAECNRHLGNFDEAREQYRGFLERAPHSALRGSVERQLARLDRQSAPPPAELVAPLPTVRPPVADAHAGRVAKAIGIAGWVASAASLALGLYTWHEMSSLESAAHADLEALRPIGGPTAGRSAGVLPEPGLLDALVADERRRLSPRLHARPAILRRDHGPASSAASRSASPAPSPTSSARIRARAIATSRSRPR